MPLWLIEAYAAAMPQVTARRLLDDVDAVALGSATYKKSHAQRRLAELREQAEMDRSGKKRPASPRLLRAAGIRVEFKGGEKA